MRNLSVILCLLLVATTVSAIETTEDTDFRAARWGMTATEVYELETLPLDSSGYDYLTYNSILFDEEVAFTYGFENEFLVKATYEFMPWASSKTGLFNSCKEALIARYGEPTDEQLVYHGSSFPSMSPGEMESAVNDGKLELISEWETPRSTIRLYAGQSSAWFPALVTLRYAAPEER